MSQWNIITFMLTTTETNRSETIAYLHTDTHFYNEISTSTCIWFVTLITARAHTRYTIFSYSFSLQLLFVCCTSAVVFASSFGRRGTKLFIIMMMSDDFIWECEFTSRTHVKCLLYKPKAERSWEKRSEENNDIQLERCVCTAQRRIREDDDTRTL